MQVSHMIQTIQCKNVNHKEKTYFLCYHTFLMEVFTVIIVCCEKLEISIG